MEENNTKTQADDTALFAGDAWFDPIEAGIRDRVRRFVEPRGLPDIEELIGQELDAALGRGRYAGTSHQKACRAEMLARRKAALDPA